MAADPRNDVGLEAGAVEWSINLTLGVPVNLSFLHIFRLIYIDRYILIRLLLAYSVGSIETFAFHTYFLLGAIDQSSLEPLIREDAILPAIMGTRTAL